MSRKVQASEQIVAKQREAEMFLAKGKTVPEACRTIGGYDQTFYRCCNGYSGLKVD